MTIYEKLLAVQGELKAPKGQLNSFGGYKFRNCEDILEAVKPLLQKNKATIILDDDLVVLGERYYIKATAQFIDVESGEKVENHAYAREEESKKGMDGSQITGASSSYARKYALNGLLNIDDTKDSDTTNMGSYKQESIPKEWTFKGGRFDGMTMIEASNREDFEEYISMLKKMNKFDKEMEQEYNLMIKLNGVKVKEIVANGIKD